MLAKIRGFKDWLETTEEGRGFIWWVSFVLGMVLLFFFGILPQVQAQVFAYPDVGACTNDVHHGEDQQGYIKQYPNEIELIADNAFEIYSLAGDQTTCYEVPSSYKSAATFSNTVNITTYGGITFSLGLISIS